jgi:hypothetical protein
MNRLATSWPVSAEKIKSGCLRGACGEGFERRGAPQVPPLRCDLSKTILPYRRAFPAPHKGPGAPSFAFFAKGGMPRLFTPRLFPASSAYPTLRTKREGWGTRSFVWGKKYPPLFALPPRFHHLAWARRPMTSPVGMPRGEGPPWSELFVDVRNRVTRYALHLENEVEERIVRD